MVILNLLNFVLETLVYLLELGHVALGLLKLAFQENHVTFDILFLLIEIVVLSLLLVELLLHELIALREFDFHSLHLSLVLLNYGRLTLQLVLVARC